MKNKSHLTAIARKTLPAPTRWLMKMGVIQGKVLDYGCGRCWAVNPKEWDNYDPHFEPDGLPLYNVNYDTIVCNYVLCVLPQEDRMDVLRIIKYLLTKDGMAFISVRNDRPDQGWGYSKKGTYQGRFRKNPLRQVYKCSGFRTYILTKNTELV
jgi:ATP adenylyltransferase